MPTMNPKTWALKDWCNFFAAVPAAFSLMTLFICGIFLLLFWMTFSGMIVVVPAVIAIFIGSMVVVRAALKPRV